VVVEQGHQWRAQDYTALPKHVTNIAVYQSCLPTCNPMISIYKDDCYSHYFYFSRLVTMQSISLCLAK